MTLPLQRKMEGPFVCSACTFANNSGSHCSMCGGARPATRSEELLVLALARLEVPGGAARSTAHAHALRHVTSRNNWFCDVCKQPRIATDARYRCGTCTDYDSCDVCHTSSHPHPLKRVLTLSDGRWWCDRCGVRSSATDPVRRFRCFDCADYDMCGLCIAQTLPEAVSAPSIAAPEPAPAQRNQEQAPVADEAKNCVVCMDHVATHACVPCGHRCVCGECGPRLRSECPLCRTHVQLFMRVYD